MLRRVLLLVLCVIGYLQVTAADKCNIRCESGAKFSAQLFDVEAEGLAPLDSHFRCHSETDPGQCDRCCRLWAASEGRSNVVGHIVGETGCYCCFPQCRTS